MFEVEIEFLSKRPNIKLLKHGDKFRIFNSETKKYLVSSTGGVTYEWRKDIYDWDTSVSSWKQDVARGIVLDIYT